MKTLIKSPERILAVMPCKRGFAFVVLESDRGLLDWGVKYEGREKRRSCLHRIAELLDLYKPDRLIVEDLTDSRRGQSTSAFVHKALQLAKVKNIKSGIVKKQRHSASCEASDIATQFPELIPRQPAKRKPWEGRNVNASLYQAAAMTIAFMAREQSPTP